MVTRKGVSLPQDLAKALDANKPAHAAFEAMRPSCQKRYAAWIENAKKPETSQRRIKRALEMAQDWKQRHQHPKVKSQIT